MFKFSEPNKLNEVIDALIDAIAQDKDKNSKEFTASVDLLAKLYKLKETDVKLIFQEAELNIKAQQQDADTEIKKLDILQKMKEMKIPFGLKPETVAIIAANLLGIVLVLNHERLNVVTSKAFGFIKNLKN